MCGDFLQTFTWYQSHFGLASIDPLYFNGCRKHLLHPFSLSIPWFTWWPSNSPLPIISYGRVNFFLSLKANNSLAMWMELLYFLHGLLLLTLRRQTSSTWCGKKLTSASWVFCSPPSRRKPWPRSWVSPPHARSG